jgi:hypothetical protein
MVVHICNPRTLNRQKEGDFEFEGSLNYTIRSCLKNKANQEQKPKYLYLFDSGCLKCHFSNEKNSKSSSGG